MKRIVFSVAFCAGLMLASATTASAAVYCSDDPTLSAGTPVQYSLNVSLGTSLTSTNAYASGTSKTTTFGASLGIK